MIGVLSRIGRLVIDLIRDAGATALLAWRCLRALVSRRMEWREALRQGSHFGVGSLTVLTSTAALVGGILVVQSGLYVRRYGIQELVGWTVGFGILRLAGPLVAGLVFSGRVGSRNAAEIAAMSTRDQLEGLRAMGIDLVPAVIAPRAVAMAVSLVLLYFIGAAVSILTAAGTASALLNIDWPQFERSFLARTQVADVVVGVSKSAAFAAAVALISCRSGLAARGGATAVGDAAKSAVVRGAFAIVVLDLLVSQVLG